MHSSASLSLSFSPSLSRAPSLPSLSSPAHTRPSSRASASHSPSQASAHPIVDLTAGQAPHNDPSRALVCSADGAGDVHVHALEVDGTWGHCTTFGVSTHDGTPSLCTTLRMRGVLLYCGYSTGHVRIFDLVSCALAVQISAHSRWINALEVHPNGSTFASAAEDTTINVWRLTETGNAPKVRHPAPLALPTFNAFIRPSSRTPSRTASAHGPCAAASADLLALLSLSSVSLFAQVAHVVSIPVPDALLAGVTFCGGFEKSHVAASAYDVAALQAWKID